MISVVIPVFNKEKYISATLFSVWAQTYKNWECIIVNDGSTDSSLSTINDFIERHPNNWKVITKNNSGQADTRNIGISEAHGKYIAFLDADDFWINTKLQEQLEVAVKGDFDVVLSDYLIFNESLKRFRLVRLRNVERDLFGWLKMKKFGALPESSALFKRSVLQNLNGFNNLYTTSGGLDLMLRAYPKYKIALSKVLHVLYRINEGQWHTNIKELEIDLIQLQSANYSQKVRNLVTFHNIYLQLTSARKEVISKKNKVKIIRRLFQHPFVTLILVFSILIRNIKSFFYGNIISKKYKKSGRFNYLFYKSEELDQQG